MYSKIDKNSYNPNFGLKIRLCDKSKLVVPHNANLLNSPSPMDFFYRENKIKSKTDLLLRNVKSSIRKKQQKEDISEGKKQLLKTCYTYINKFNFVLNKLALFENPKSVYKTMQVFKKLEPDSPEYINTLAKIGNSTKQKFININIEDGIFEEIAKSNEPVIFMMNHDNPARDKFAYPILNSFLNYSYATLGKQNDCPRPYIIVSKNVIKGAGNNTMKKIFQKIGLVPIDANMTERNTRVNINPMRDLINKFVENKANIFIFPEGNNSIYPEKPLEEKFQLGLSKMIKKILEKKSTVRVLPIGISYNTETNNMGTFHLGKIIKLNRNNKICEINSEGNSIKLGNLNDKNTLNEITTHLCIKLKENVIASKNMS